MFSPNWYTFPPYVLSKRKIQTELTFTILVKNCACWIHYAGDYFSCFVSARPRQASPNSCRFELVCAQCLNGCQSDLSNVIIDRNTLPVCDPIPVGVWPLMPETTLQTLDMKEGYFRISTESPIVLKCFRQDACLGGIEQSDYCATGYTGPCKFFHTKLLAHLLHRSYCTSC